MHAYTKYVMWGSYRVVLLCDVIVAAAGGQWYAALLVTVQYHTLRTHAHLPEEHHASCINVMNETGAPRSCTRWQAPAILTCMLADRCSNLIDCCSSLVGMDQHIQSKPFLQDIPSLQEYFILFTTIYSYMLQTNKMRMLILELEIVFHTQYSDIHTERIW